MSEVLHRLGSVPVSRFMRDTWQRRPLLIRAAFENFRPPVGRKRLLELARQPEAEVRLIERVEGRWLVSTSPLKRLPSPRRPGWTVLVQGVDLLDEGAHALLGRFRFVPDARLDDLMISYATDGGGVGPHVDSYDVFLLQASGRRRWRFGRQRDLQCVEGAALPTLAHFRPTREFTLEPGDMLYLPPGVAHEGTALGECITYSIGFRAPSYQELLEPFLTDVAAHSVVRGRYRDPGLVASKRPGALPEGMVRQLHTVLAARRPGPADTARFLLSYLSEPKAQVVFERPSRSLRIVDFANRARRHGIVLDRRTRFLYRGRAIGINGECMTVPAWMRRPLRGLADRRSLAAAELSEPILGQLHAWYRAGWLHVDD